MTTALAREINLTGSHGKKSFDTLQNLIDRILGIAHVEVVAQDKTNPDLEIVGMPASRQLFEQLRDCIEIQRQAKNVVGVIS